MSHRHLALRKQIAFFSACALGFLTSAIHAQDKGIDPLGVLGSLSNPPLQFFASTDPKKQNADYLLLKPNETRRIPLAGGTLLRFWCTSLDPEKTTVRLQNGAHLVPLLQNGRAAIAGAEFYEKALAFYPVAGTPDYGRTLQPGTVLIVTNGAKAETKFFYQATISPAGVPAKFPTGPVTQILGEDKATIPAGQSGAPLQVAANGKSGIVTEIRISVTPTNLETLSHVYLRVDRLKITGRSATGISSSKDGESHAVYAPVADLAGQFFALQPVQNAMTSFDGKKLTLRWPMPFDATRDDLQISLENKSAGPVDATLSASVTAVPKPPPFLFCAISGSTRAQRGKPIPILAAKGSGAFVGLNLGIAPTADSIRRTFAYLEGNEQILADGKLYEGTGSEDYFNSAWYFPSKSFARPYHGLTFRSETPPRVAAYRLMLPDAVTFQKTLKFDFESGKANNSDDMEYRWVAFWYQKAPLDFQIADTLGNAAANTNTTTAPGTGANGQGGSNSGVFWVALGVLSIVGIAWALRRKNRL